METIELSDLTVTEIPPDIVLYKEVLCEKINSKFKKSQVTLKRSSTIEGTPVYNFELTGKAHKNHLAFDFDAKDLCFMRCEEKQENVHEPSCFCCWNRNFYPSIVYTRLIMMWYSKRDSSSEASCIKVPLMQQGNAYAATALKRLESIIYSQVVGADQLKHWQVFVLRCGDMPSGSRMFVGLTQFALVLLHDYQILAYHDLLSNDFGICHENDNILHVTVNSRSQSEEEHAKNNFSLSTMYVFKTPHAKFIEASLQSLQKHNENQSSLPVPHFNIRHQEHSASGIVPGTMSDNFSIIPHHSNPAYIEDSSGSNGHIPNGPGTFSDNIIVHSHPSPPPHFQGMSNTGSNGVIPGSGSATVAKEVNMIDEYRASSNVSEFEMNNNTILLSRGCAPDPKIINVNIHKPAIAERPATLGKPRMNVVDVSESDINETQVKQCPSPPQMHKSLTPSKELCDSSPVKVTAFDDWKKSRYSATEADLGDGLDFAEFDFENENDVDLSLQPPPAPCGNTAHPVQEFRYKPPEPLPKTYKVNSDPENKYIHPLPRRPKPFLMRAQSLDMLEESHLMAHSYVNFELQSVQMRNAHDDSLYFRFYYNYGFVRMLDARMSKKIERRSRLSSHIENIDFNFLDKHEQWFDRCYKSREKDLKFLKITKMNIPVSPSPSATGTSPYSRVKPDEPSEDDPYWNSDLSITIQAKLQDKTLGVGDVFDLTQEQLIELQVLLSLVPAQNNWKDLAEYIGLVSEDIAVIEHFCYTYKHLAAEIVLSHWVMQQKRGKSMNRQCTRDNLLSYLEEMGRDDILKYIKVSSRRQNEQIQTDEDMDVFIDVMEATHL